jgi:hypothetical protein
VPDIRGIGYLIINAIPGRRGQVTGWPAAAAGRPPLLFQCGQVSMMPSVPRDIA